MKKKREKLITESLKLCLLLSVQGSGFCYGEMIIRKDGFEPRSNRRAVSSKSSVIFFFPYNCFCAYCNCCTLVPSTAWPGAVPAWISEGVTRVRCSESAAQVGKAVQFSVDALT